MKITIERNLLLNKLNMVSHALIGKTPLPVLTAIKMSVSEHGVIFIASNSDISIRTKLTYDELKVEETGDVAVSGKMFCDIIRMLKSPEVLIYTEDSVLKISAGRGNYKLNLMDVDNYPNINFDGSYDTTAIEFEGETFNNIVKNVIVSASQSEKKPILTGINFNLTNGKLVAVATDSFRLSRITSEKDNCADFNMTVPNSALNELMKCIDSNEKIELDIVGNSAKFTFNNTEFITRLIDGQYPNTEKLIINEFEREIEFDKEELMNASDRIMILSPSGSEKEREITYNVVTLKQTSATTAVLETQTSTGEAKEEINISVVSSKEETQNLDITFSGKYFIDALKTFKSNKVTIKFNGSFRPFIIEGTDDKGLIQLILPVRK